MSGSARNIISVLLAVLVLISTTTTAIHEDEQGLRDWLVRFVGSVEHATVSPVASPNQMFVSSAQGAVAALNISANGGVNVTWREILTEVPQCIAATSHGVMAVSASGSVHVLNTLTGVVEITYHLTQAGAGAKQFACAELKEKYLVAAYDGSTIYFYNFDNDAHDEEIAPLRVSIKPDTAVDSMCLAGSHLWVSSAGQSTHYDTASGKKGASVSGRCTSATNSGQVVVTTADKEAMVYTVNGEGPKKGDSCSHCSLALALNPETETSAGAVKLTTEASEAMLVRFPSASVEVPSLPGAAAPRLLLAFTHEEEEAQYALVKTGSHHLVLVTSDGRGVVWERKEGLAAVSSSIIVEPAGKIDNFHFFKLSLHVSQYGTVYAVPLVGKGRTIDVIADISAAARQQLTAASMDEVSINQMKAVSPTEVVIRATKGETVALITVDYVRRKVTKSDATAGALFASPTLLVGKDRKVLSTLSYPEAFFYVAHEKLGLVEGYRVSNTTRTATPTWSVRLPHSIVASTSVEDPDRTAIVNNIRVFPNRSGKELVDEVRHRYPTRNVIAVAFYEPSEDELSTLVVVALDAITGSMLATTRHKNVEGPVRMVLVEHTLIYYFLDASKMRYCFGVWEMFEEESGAVISKSAGATLPQIIASFFVKTQRTFSSRAARPPVVVASTLGVYGGPVADMSVTTSQSAIARKNIVLAFETGRVAVVEARLLLTGGQMPMDPSGERQMTHAIIPSVFLASHKYRLALPKRITTNPTALESSCHVLVTGMDLFYVRSSSGKPFDLLNSDFNKPLLIVLVGVFAGLSVLTRYLVVRKSLNTLWR